MESFIQVDDVIPLLPAVGWVAAATLVVMFSKDSCNVVCELCLMLGGTKMWLNGFHILVFIMLYSLVTSTLWGFLLVEAMHLQSFQTLENGISEVLCLSR